MRFARFRTGGKIAYGVVADGMVEEISSTPFLQYELTGIRYALDDVRLLSPCLASKVVAVARNYRDHAAEMGKPLPKVPEFFFKPSTAVIGPADAIFWPPGCRRLDYEGELALVIGAVARSVRPDSWREVVLGLTCGIDATARDLQEVDGQWGRAKGFDTSAPLGPWIDTEADPSDLRLVTRVNGEVKQDSTTAQLVFGVPELVAFITSYVTLLPGDVILTGTPAGIGPLSPGDRLQVEIDSIGALTVAVRGTPPPD